VCPKLGEKIPMTVFTHPVQYNPLHVLTISTQTGLRLRGRGGQTREADQKSGHAVAKSG